MEQLAIFDAQGAPIAPLHAVAREKAAASASGASSRQPMPTPAARHSDPETSKLAAARAKDLAHEHHGRILEALEHAPGTIYEIAARIGLTHVQVARRLPELHGHARATEETRPSPSGRACRVWRLA